MPDLSVIIPAYNAASTLGATLTALEGQDFAGSFEVIVVDDGSTDATAALAEEAPSHVRVVRTAGGLGPGPARNAGVAASSSALLAFTDADCVPTPAWLTAGVDALARAELVQGAVHADPAVQPRPFDRTIWVKRETGLYECASLFATRDLFDRLGGFEDWLDVSIGKPLAEDAWLGWRARRAGAQTVFVPDALVHHAVFRRGLREFVAERVRVVYFPAIVRRMPELRRTMLFKRLFLARRTAAFDGAFAGLVTAFAVGTPLPLLAAVPWAWLVAKEAWPWRRRAPRVALGGALADLVSFGALLWGSVRYLNPVL